MTDQPTPLAERLREALAAEYMPSARMHGIPDDWAADAAETGFQRVLRALARAGLVLAEREGAES